MPGHELAPRPFPTGVADGKRGSACAPKPFRERHWLGWVVIITALLPASALANAGTPLMWAGMLHLAIGNAVIGALEGFLLVRLFGAPAAKGVGVMIAANYFSAWVGGVLIGGWIVDRLELTLGNAWFWFWAMVAVTFLLTLILEWPFVAWNLRGTPGWLKRSVPASLLIQGSSYLLLFGWYWTASVTSLYTRTAVVDSADLPLPEQAVVYYLGREDGDVYRRSLRGGPATKIFELNSEDRNDRLFAARNGKEPERWDLAARLETADRNLPKMLPVLTNLNVEAVTDWRREAGGLAEPTSFNFGTVPRLGHAKDSPWEFWCEFWAAGGLTATHQGTGARVWMAYETPFGAWRVRNVYHLPGDLALFQLGEDQICAFDPAGRRVALLWHGRGAVPMLEKKAALDRVLTRPSELLELWEESEDFQQWKETVAELKNRIRE